MKFCKKPVVIEATQWFKNGDHPDDYNHDTVIVNTVLGGLQTTETIPGEEQRQKMWEGQIVRYFRHPSISGDSNCKHCGLVLHIHGWIDTKEGGHIVCPGDMIITGVAGERYPCKPDIFRETYVPEGHTWMP